MVTLLKQILGELEEMMPGLKARGRVKKAHASYDVVGYRELG